MTQDVSSKDKANRRVVWWMGFVFVGMFGFSFALIPLYDAICEITGLNGKTGRIESQAAEALQVDDSRLITVEFVARVKSGMEWEFKPLVRKMKVHPGELNEALFLVRNTTDRSMDGQAIPSLVPNVAAKYFDKTECFCFNRQTVGAGESREMPMRFVIDPELPLDVKTVALSYTFFELEPEATAGKASDEKISDLKERG